MSDWGKCTLGEKQELIAAMRKELLSENEFVRTNGLRSLLTGAIQARCLWFDQAGKVCQVEKTEGFLACLVELAILVIFDDL